MNQDLKNKLEALQKASHTLSLASTSQRNKALESIKEALQKNSNEILTANKKDLEKMSTDNPLFDRLKLDEKRIENICNELDNIISLNDPLNEIKEERDVKSGIHLKKITVPIGCIGVIYEARPNVTIDVSALCLKSGNTILLRGSTSAYESNKAIVKIIKEALTDTDIDSESIQLLEPDHEIAAEMMKADKYLDLIIPRGGKSLIDRVRQESTVPVIETGASVVHTFVDESADFSMACDIIHNEKTRRPSVCNALDTLLVHQDIAKKFLPELSKKMKDSHVLIHTHSEAKDSLRDYPQELIKEDIEKTLDTEFLSLEMNILIVKNIEEAISHIRKYSLKHSESIVTKSKENAQKFQAEVDAACVYVNTSTAFSDGAQFGLGAEIGISTQKLHARGPMGLKELTSYKWLIESEGLVRK